MMKEAKALKQHFTVGQRVNYTFTYPGARGWAVGEGILVKVNTKTLDVKDDRCHVRRIMADNIVI